MSWKNLNFDRIVKQIEHFNLIQLACKKANCLFYSFVRRRTTYIMHIMPKVDNAFMQQLPRTSLGLKKLIFFKTHHSVTRFLLQIQYQSSLPRKYLPSTYVNIRNLHDNCRRIQLYQL